MNDLLKVRLQLPHGSDPARGPGWTDLWVREGTSDEDVIEECWILDVYHLRGLNLSHSGEAAAMSIPPPRVLDIGSCTGIFTALVAQMYPDTRIVAVEPDADNRTIAAKNIPPAWDHRIFMVPCAVGAQSGQVALAGGFGTGHTETIAPSGPGGGVQVVTQVTLEELIGGEPVALLKLDVEGAEYEIIDACPVGQLEQVDLIHMEWHGPEMCPWVKGHYGDMLHKLAMTHAVNVFGRPNVGGMLFAHRYPD